MCLYCGLLVYIFGPILTLYSVIIVIMEMICKAPTLRLKPLSKHITHLMRDGECFPQMIIYSSVS